VKLCVLFDAKGKIIAASRLDVQTKVPLPRPVATKKLHTLELDVPVKYHSQLRAICQCLRVDAKRKQLVSAKPSTTKA
jgi:hypothetical protein